MEAHTMLARTSAGALNGQIARWFGDIFGSYFASVLVAHGPDYSQPSVSIPGPRRRSVEQDYAGLRALVLTIHPL